MSGVSAPGRRELEGEAAGMPEVGTSEPDVPVTLGAGPTPDCRAPEALGGETELGEDSSMGPLGRVRTVERIAGRRDPQRREERRQDAKRNWVETLFLQGFHGLWVQKAQPCSSSGVLASWRLLGLRSWVVGR